MAVDMIIVKVSNASCFLTSLTSSSTDSTEGGFGCNYHPGGSVASINDHINIISSQTFEHHRKLPNITYNNPTANTQHPYNSHL